MIKRALIVISILFFATWGARAESPIDFSASDNLKAVYDAGFRPWRDGMSSCNLDHIKVEVLLPENGRFSLSAQMAGFSVLADDQLSSSDFYSEVTSTDEAVTKIREICGALGISTAGLDQAVPNFSDRFSKPLRWGGMTTKGNISVQVMLDLLSLEDHFAARIGVFLHWKRNDTPMKFLTSPVQPPPGYENASMEPPKVNPNQKGFPAHDLQYYKDLIDKKKAEDAKAAAASSAPIAPPSSSAVTASVQAESSWPWLWIILVIILLGVIILWFKSRPK